jgi:hypothetical protein
MTIPIWAIYSIIFLLAILLAVKLYHVMNDEANPIEWWQFISTKGADGKPYADLTKLGQAVGIFTSAAVVFVFSARKDADTLGFCAVFTIALTYLGGVQAFQAYMKSKNQPQQEQK